MKADVGPTPPPSPEKGVPPARQSQKEATRQRVITAARELFDTHGYEGTTIREIARHAGVAVGSVFTTFASKGEILSEVMAARLDPLYAEIDRVMPHVRGSTADRLRTMFAVHFEFEARHVRLFLSHIAAAYDWTLAPGARPYGRNQRLQQIIRETLLRGQAEGDVRHDIDLQEVIDLLCSAYAWTYRLVITNDTDAKGMIAVMDRQIGLIADGFAPRD
ncbi:TetR/AcrR family transcriptional regulator [Phenylobacterium sp.]|uniref:TetR/AcrR family transcriptional regulator n=1 Tax=Phenylobacterium sp. TaxID=1871053 RepID=UPI0025D55F8D|nr:TetR/AcrR family transcriptional regulator [Phenylobacterium sp.]MBX3481873.1 TetR/AcrR family transcriptional regulator [Phenylobacterium sp.]MCW5759128.1 TetR/AcrR family transcriptional regulator [Phenylobacterium sp.]